jgi:hypothetical protein
MQNKKYINASLEIFVLSKSKFILKRAVKNLDMREYFYCNLTKKIKHDMSSSIKGNIRKNGQLVFKMDDFRFEINEKDLANLKHQKI